MGSDPNWIRLFFAAVAMSLSLAGCGTPDPGAAGSVVAPEEPVDINVLIANADVKRGQNLYLQCRACHSLNQGGMNKVGPNLYGMFGSKAGFAPGFAYSEALIGTDVVWTPETLSEWLARPSQFMPGNRMVFVGVKKPQDRANIIAFLQQATSGASN